MRKLLFVLVVSLLGGISINGQDAQPKSTPAGSTTRGQNHKGGEAVGLSFVQRRTRSNRSRGC